MDLEDRIQAELTTRGEATNKDLREAIFPDADDYVPELDKALQRLKKSGKIKYASKVWFPTNRIACPHCSGRGYLK
jgi:hypothetical protein